MSLLDYDEEQFVRYLDNASNLLERASALGAELAGKGYSQMVFVGCGAPNRVIRIIQNYVDTHVGYGWVRSYLPAEFIDINASVVDDQTVVVFGSYSGTTKETVDAAKYAKNLPGETISITRFDDSPLSQQVSIMLNYGDTKLGDYSRFMITSAFTSGFLSVAAPEKWTIHQDLLTALYRLPKVLGAVVTACEEQNHKFTKQYFEDDQLFVVGHGPVYHVAYLLAFCSFMEMQWMHATPLIGAEFFHGPFELLNDQFPVMVLIGEDATRKQGLRVQEFCRTYLKKYEIYDSAEYEMEGIDPSLRPYFSSIVLDAATRRLMDYYAQYRKHDKTKRRYMGVVDY